jgi:hypothetical protein
VVDHDIPDDVKQFITDCIGSFGQLEVLLLLAENPERVWSAPEVGTELRSGETSGKHLDDLTKMGLIVHLTLGGHEGFQFLPKDSERIQVVKRLIAAHETFRHRIISLIYDKPNERLRELANAFKLGSKDDTDG